MDYPDRYRKAQSNRIDLRDVMVMSGILSISTGVFLEWGPGISLITFGANISLLWLLTAKKKGL